MKLRADALAKHLRKELAPVYLITGDEPLQLQESLDLIRDEARKQGYSERIQFEAGRGFDWHALAAEADSLSLFAEQRIIELRIPSGKLGRDGGQAIASWMDKLPQDTMLLMVLPKLDRAQLSSKWAKSVDKRGVIVQVWPIAGRALPAWIRQRAGQYGLQLSNDAVQLLVQHTEGNLLAASQELEKLHLTHGKGEISLAQIGAAVSGNARYTPFELVDAALSGDAAHAIRILDTLKGEGIAIQIVLWAVARDLRTVADIALCVERSGSAAEALARQRVWESRRQLVVDGARRVPASGWQRLVNKAAEVDDGIKGGGQDPWLLLEEIVFGMSGKQLLA